MLTVTMRTTASLTLFQLVAIYSSAILGAELVCQADESTVDESAVELREFIFDDAPFPQCHASTIAASRDGTLVAAWFGGTREKHPDVGIWLARRGSDGWSAPVEVANGVQSTAERHPCWNPVLFQPSKGPLLLFFKVGPSPSTWWGEMMNSEDGGRTWTDRQRLPKGVVGPIKNKPIETKFGEILCGSSTEHAGWRVHFESTRDLKAWSVTFPINDGKQISAIQPSILQHGEERFQAIGRSRQGKLWTAWSENRGVSWGEMTLLDIPNPNSGTDAVTLADARHLLVYNNTPHGRTPLNIALSGDGTQWKPVLTLEDEPGEYSYPAVIQTTDGRVHVTYTWQRRRIRHLVIDPAKL